MKIAVVSDDGATISQHFGRAAHYVMGHAHFSGEAHGEANDSRGHGFDAGAQSRHARMLDAIADCKSSSRAGWELARTRPFAPRTLRRS